MITMEMLGKIRRMHLRDKLSQHEIAKRTGLALLIGMTCCGASLAGLDEGLAALAKGNDAVAAKELRPLAERGNAEAQYRIGLMHEFGRGYPVDKAQAVA